MRDIKRLWKSDKRWAGVFVVLLLAAVSVPVVLYAQRRPRGGTVRVIQLPEPKTKGSFSVEQALSERRSVRQFGAGDLGYVQIGQLAWAGQGITEPQRGLRTAPSAGALYPIQLYFVTNEGLFVYQPAKHSLQEVVGQDLRGRLSAAALNQEWVAQAACDIVIAGSARKLAGKYGNRAQRYMLLEAGHVSQNILLQAVSMALAAVPVGAFEIKNVAKVCRMTGDLEPLMIVCVGQPVGGLAKEQAGQLEQAKRVEAAAGKKAVLVAASRNFRDEELFETRRILNEAGVETVVASTTVGPIRGVLGGLAASEVLVSNLDVGDYDAIVFIGGPGVAEYVVNADVLNLAREAARQRKVVGAIETGPTVLANAALLRGVRVTGFVSEQERLVRAGAHYTGAPVERDGYFVTASGPLAVVPFGQAIVQALRQEGARAPTRSRQ